MKKIRFLNRDKLSMPVGQGVIAGIMEVCYIALVSIFIVGTQSFFSNSQSWMAVFGIVGFLSLLVLSVAVSGVLVFGYPAQYFMERKYKEALSTLISTAATMFVILAIIFLAASLSQFV
jgi:hypothetical protein